MPGYRTMQFAFPEFSGATRKLILWNLAAYFLLLILGALHLAGGALLVGWLGLLPPYFLHGMLWQLATYSFVHLSLLGTALELLSLWFIAGFLEGMHPGKWVMGLYAASVAGAGLTAVAIYALEMATGHPSAPAILTGCMGGIFGLITAIGILYGEMQFQLFFVLGIKARYLAILYGLIALAETFGEQRMYAFAQLGGGLAAYLYRKWAPRKGLFFSVSEGWYGLRNRYYRWKRRRAAARFEVYMRKQGRTVRFDSQGRLIDEDDRSANDRSRWN